MELNITVLIGIAASICTFIWTVYQYIDTKKENKN
jgi:hypothetical protein